MVFHQQRAVLALSAAVLIALASPALARRSHHRQLTPQASQQANVPAFGESRDDRYSTVAEAGPAPASRRRASRRTVTAPVGEFTSSDLVSEARRYVGTNPTGRGSLWCGAFMDLVLKRTGHTGGGNLASAYARYGTRVAGPQVGAIAVMGRRGGGHVGVVTGVDANGNVIVISGNHNRTVAESVYPRGRIVAYVMPGS